MTPEETLQNGLDAMKADMTNYVDEKFNNVEDVDVDGLKDLIANKATSEELTTVKEVVSEMETTIKAMKESGSTKPESSLLKSIKEKEAEMKSMYKNKAGNANFTVTKDFSTAGAFNPTWEDFLQPQYVDGIVRSPDKEAEFNILNSVTVGRAFAEIVKWIEEDTETGAALFIDECIAKPDVSKDWKRNEATVRKVADYTRICDEVLLYVDWAEQEIRLFLRKLVYKAFQEQIINGDGVGENLLGIVPQATAFVAGSLAATVPLANSADAIGAMANQIRCLGHAGVIEAHMNCTDIFLLDQALKDTTGQYLTSRTGGAIIVDNPWIPAGSVLVGVMKNSNVRFFQDITVDMGLNGEDFRENAVSMRGEAFLTHYIPSNLVSSFIYDTLANVIALILKP